MLPQILSGRDWQHLRMDCQMSRQNREKITEEWCIVCGSAAVEDHSTRFHAAGGVLAGPFCSGRCAWHWLRDDRLTDGEYPRRVVRKVYREDTGHLEFERYSRSEKFAGATLFPRGSA